MAFTFDSTISGADSNSYVTLVAANDYFGGTLDDTAWSSLSDTIKEQLLTIATTRLESETYGGYAALTTQRLQFPREKLVTRYADDYNSNMGYYPDDVYHVTDDVPKEIQQATFELAIYFYNKSIDNLGTIDEIDLEQLSKYAIGPLSVDIQSGFKVEQLPSKVTRMLSAAGPDTWSGGQQTTAVRG